MKFWLNKRYKEMKEFLKRFGFSEREESVFEKQDKGCKIVAKAQKRAWQGMDGVSLEIYRDYLVWASKDLHKIVKNDLGLEELKKQLKELAGGKKDA